MPPLRSGGILPPLITYELNRWLESLEAPATNLIYQDSSKP